MDAVVTALLHTLEDPEKKQDTWTPALDTDSLNEQVDPVFQCFSYSVFCLGTVRAWRGTLKKLIKFNWWEEIRNNARTEAPFDEVAEVHEEQKTKSSFIFRTRLS